MPAISTFTMMSNVTGVVTAEKNGDLGDFFRTLAFGQLGNDADNKAEFVAETIRDVFFMPLKSVGFVGDLLGKGGKHLSEVANATGITRKLHDFGFNSRTFNAYMTGIECLNVANEMGRAAIGLATGDLAALGDLGDAVNASQNFSSRSPSMGGKFSRLVKLGCIVARNRAIMMKVPVASRSARMRYQVSASTFGRQLDVVENGIFSGLITALSPFRTIYAKAKASIA